MVITDTHIHLYAEEFSADRDALIQEAIDSGIKRFFLPNIDSTTIDLLLALEGQHPENCFPMMGLHPCSVDQDFEALEGIRHMGLIRFVWSHWFDQSQLTTVK